MQQRPNLTIISQELSSNHIFEALNESINEMITKSHEIIADGLACHIMNAEMSYLYFGRIYKPKIIEANSKIIDSFAKDIDYILSKNFQSIRNEITCKLAKLQL